MMKWLESRLFWGVVLIVAGVLFLLQNLFGVQLGGIFWSALFILGGLFFLSVFYTERANWWAIIPGFTLVGIGLLIGLGTVFPAAEDVLGGAIVLGSISLSFFFIYLLNRDFWWALIPTGVLATLAVVIAFENLLTDFGFVSLFFLGMALTFAVVALVPTPQGKMTWSWIPAGILGLMGIIFGAFSGAFMTYLTPLILILGGGFLIYRAMTNR
mgnify:CR=1 FL=1